MKLTMSIIVFLFFIFPFEMYPQITNERESIPSNLFQEKHSFKSILDEHIGQYSESNFFNGKESRTIVSKTILDNGFLLTEYLWQEWNGSNWVNYYKLTYTYILTGIEQLTDGIKTYSMSNNYPNPFNPSTTISYSVPELSFVTLKVYDVLGNKIATVVNQEKPLGSYEVEFNASTLTLSSGIYFYKLQVGPFVETKKMVLMK